MVLSGDAVSTLNNMAGGGRFLLRGDQTHGFQIRHDKRSAKRKDKTCRSLPFMERAGWIEFGSLPLDLHRYYSVKLTKQGAEVLKKYS